VGLWHTEPAPVPLGAHPGPASHGSNSQLSGSECPIQLPPGGIDPVGIFERGLGVGEHPFGDDPSLTRPER